jgi:uncharacterized membrane protein YfcA
MDEMSTIYFLIIAAFASIFSGTFGFGAGIIFLPLGAMFLPIKEVIAIACILFVLLNISKMCLYWKDIAWKTVIAFLLGSIPASVVGSFLMLEIDEVWLKKIIGVMLLLYVFYKKYGGLGHIKFSKKRIAMGGAVYGFITGMTGMGNFAKAATLSHVGLKKTQFVATMAALPFLTTPLRMWIYSRGGFYDSISWTLVLGFAVCAFGGAYLGRNLLRKMTQNFFDNAILIILTVMAFKFLFF